MFRRNIQPPFSMLKMDAVRLSDTPIHFYQTIRCQVPEDSDSSGNIISRTASYERLECAMRVKCYHATGFETGEWGSCSCRHTYFARRPYLLCGLPNFPLNGSHGTHWMGPGREANHSLQSTAEVKNAWSHYSNPSHVFYDAIMNSLIN
jgi:hypothetical protein